MIGREPRTSTSNTKSIHGTKKKSRYICLTFAVGLKFLIHLKGKWRGFFYALVCYKRLSIVNFKWRTSRRKTELSDSSNTKFIFFVLYYDLKGKYCYFYFDCS